MAKNKHIFVFLTSILILFFFFMWMFSWLRSNSPTEEFGAIDFTQEQTTPALKETR
ncbi:MAG: hypothetical protein ACI97A_000312 [Planctomycetota bacterium]|jgi:hypothetical protein